MRELLKQYLNHNEFIFKIDDNLAIKCNAPKDAGGIYIVSILSTGIIIYIGSSGWLCQNGEFEIRDGGMYDRIVNGKQFEKARKKSWPLKMRTDGIEVMKVEWFNTFNDKLKHIPAFVEASLIQMYFEANFKLPIWNKEF